MPFDKKFWITFAAILVVAMMLGFVIHGVLLAAEYETLTPNVMRPLADQEGKFGFQIVAHLMIAFGVSWLYRAGRQAGKPWLGQGIRFAIAFSFAATFPFFLIYHAVAQFPLALALKQCGFEAVGNLILGALAAFLNR